MPNCSLGCKKCSTWTMLVIGITFVGLGCFWPTLLHTMTVSGAKEGAALTKKNEPAWKGIPGQFDILLHNDHYFFHVLNPDDVVYKGMKPQFEEFGPYIYREWDNYTDVKYDQTLEITGNNDPNYKWFGPPSDAKTAKGLTCTYNQGMNLYTDSIPDNNKMDSGIDQKLNVVN